MWRQVPLPLTALRHLHWKWLEHLSCAVSFLVATGRRYLPILGAAVPHFEEARELRTSGWFNAGPQKDSVFLQESVNTDHRAHGTFCLMVGSCKEHRSLGKRDLFDRNWPNRSVSGSVLFAIHHHCLACLWFIVMQTVATVAVCVTFDQRWLAISQQLMHFLAQNQR